MKIDHIKLILIETDKPTIIFSRNKSDNELYFFTSICFGTPPQTAKSINSEVKGYYLYEIDYSRIEIGDWYIDDNHEKSVLIKANECSDHNKYNNQFRVTATINPILISDGIDELSKEFIENFNFRKI